MQKNSKLETFQKEVHNKYLVYNTLFSRLPYDKMHNVGMLLPFLYDCSKEGFSQEKTPKEIMNYFFEKYTVFSEEKDQTDLIFTIIKYIERQVVLFDSLEDASFEKLFSINGKGCLQSLMNLATQTGKTEELKSKLRNFKTKLVFTAHPTQFYPNNVLRIIQELQNSSKNNNISEIDEILQQLGKTPFINKEKPTPIKEAESILFYLRHVFYPVINQIHDKIYSEILIDEEVKPILELGFWPGGDRDGNPFVTADVTEKVAQKLRFAILKCYYKHSKEILKKLTFSYVYEPLLELSMEIYNNMFGLKNDLTSEYLLEKLLIIRETLITKHEGIFVEKLDSLINAIKIFGLYFASLDIRQDSSIHQNIMQEINQIRKISEVNYENWTEEQKIEFLINYNYEFNPQDFESPLSIDTFETIKLIRKLQNQNGEKSCHRYIISNSTNICSVLEVLALFRFAGLKPHQINVDIVPLFETIEGLNSSENTMKKLYELEYYKNHLAYRNSFQNIMLGFSDGTKDGGYLKANWGIYQTKVTLSKLSRLYDIKVVFFDGRGGPPARGGGKTHQFYASQGKDISNHEIQLTVQGQTISSMFGSAPQAKYNFEQLLTAGISNDLFHISEGNLTLKNKDLIESLAEIGLNKYLDLKNHELFVPYLEEFSPINYYGDTNIGSRPTKRNTSKKLSLKDLRAIPFVGSWSQIKQNIPGFYGVGTALQQKIEEGYLEDLKDLYNKSLYFRTLIKNSMMALSKTNFQITSFMKNNQKFSGFWNILNDEYELTLKNVLLISSLNSLMEDEPSSQLSVAFREKMILPLLTIQQYALQKIQSEQDLEKIEIYKKMLTRTLFGIINAGRNSA